MGNKESFGRAVDKSYPNTTNATNENATASESSEDADAESSSSRGTSEVNGDQIAEDLDHRRQATCTPQGQEEAPQFTEREENGYSDIQGNTEESQTATPFVTPPTPPASESSDQQEQKQGNCIGVRAVLQPPIIVTDDCKEEVRPRFGDRFKDRLFRIKGDVSRAVKDPRHGRFPIHLERDEAAEDLTYHNDRQMIIDHLLQMQHQHEQLFQNGSVTNSNNEEYRPFWAPSTTTTAGEIPLEVTDRNYSPLYIPIAELEENARRVNEHRIRGHQNNGNHQTLNSSGDSDEISNSLSPSSSNKKSKKAGDKKPRKRHDSGIDSQQSEQGVKVEEATKSPAQKEEKACESKEDSSHRPDPERDADEQGSPKQKPSPTKSRRGSSSSGSRNQRAPLGERIHDPHYHWLYHTERAYQDPSQFWPTPSSTLFVPMTSPLNSRRGSWDVSQTGWTPFYVPMFGDVVEVLPGQGVLIHENVPFMQPFGVDWSSQQLPYPVPLGHRSPSLRSPSPNSTFSIGQWSSSSPGSREHHRREVHPFPEEYACTKSANRSPANSETSSRTPGRSENANSTPSRSETTLGSPRRTSPKPASLMTITTHFTPPSQRLIPPQEQAHFQNPYPELLAIENGCVKRLARECNQLKEANKAMNRRLGERTACLIWGRKSLEEATKKLRKALDEQRRQNPTKKLNAGEKPGPLKEPTGRGAEPAEPTTVTANGTDSSSRPGEAVRFAEVTAARESLNIAISELRRLFATIGFCPRSSDPMLVVPTSYPADMACKDCPHEPTARMRGRWLDIGRTHHVRNAYRGREPVAPSRSLELRRPHVGRPSAPPTVRLAVNPRLSTNNQRFQVQPNVPRQVVQAPSGAREEVVAEAPIVRIPEPTIDPSDFPALPGTSSENLEPTEPEWPRQPNYKPEEVANVNSPAEVNQPSTSTSNGARPRFAEVDANLLAFQSPTLHQRIKERNAPRAQEVETRSVSPVRVAQPEPSLDAENFPVLPGSSEPQRLPETDWRHNLKTAGIRLLSNAVRRRPPPISEPHNVSNPSPPEAIPEFPTTEESEEEPQSEQLQNHQEQISNEGDAQEDTSGPAKVPSEPLEDDEEAFTEDDFPPLPSVPRPSRSEEVPRVSSTSRREMFSKEDFPPLPSSSKPRSTPPEVNGVQPINLASSRSTTAQRNRELFEDADFPPLPPSTSQIRSTPEEMSNVVHQNQMSSSQRNATQKGVNSVEDEDFPPQTLSRRTSRESQDRNSVNESCLGHPTSEVDTVVDFMETDSTEVTAQVPSTSTENGYQESSSGTDGDVANDGVRAEVDRRSIYIGNVDYSVTREDLRAFFSQFGAVVRATIIPGLMGVHKGYAYVEFLDGASVELALEAAGHHLGGRPIRVHRKRTNRPGLSSTDRAPRAELGRYGTPGFYSEEVYYVPAQEFYPAPLLYPVPVYPPAQEHLRQQ